MTTSAIITPRPHRPVAAEIRATLSLSWPMILTNIAQAVMMTTDVVMLGWLDPETLAGATLGSNLYFMLFTFGIGAAAATAPMMAQELGRRAHSVRDVRRTLRQGLWLVSLISIAAWLVLWQAEAIFLAIGQEPRLAALAGEYMHALMWGMLPALGFLVVRSFYAALQRPVVPMVITALAILVNAAGNWALIFGNWGMPRLGITGSGIATSLASTAMVAALIGYAYWDRRLRRYHILGRFWRFDRERLVGLVRLGLPIALTVAFEVSCFNISAFTMGYFGAATLAAHAIALQVAVVTFNVTLGIAQAATVRVGLMAGREDAAGAARAGWIALALGGGFMLLAAIVIAFTRTELVGLFLGENAVKSGEVAALAVTYLAVAALFQVVDGLQAIGAGVLRGLKDTRVPMIYAAIGYWGVGFPVALLFAFPLGFGGLGVWFGLALGLGVVAVLMVWRWSRRETLGLI